LARLARRGYMIVSTDELPALAGVVAMVDGGFDPLHDGHVRYFAAAAELGAPVLCNVSPDSWVSRKHAPLLSHEQRSCVIDAMRAISYTHIAQIETLEVLERLRPRYYVKGADWRDRLPEAQVRACAQHEIEIVILDTHTNSSSQLLASYRERETL
jgi:bifunctional ADP-heptose synthase (sugar kinase/adenylyltransferase)